MKKTIVLLLMLGAIGGAIYAYYRLSPTAPSFTVTASPVTQGDVIDTVGATGTLQAVTTVQVGTQVSGTILALNADFNSLVTKGQVLARLDPSLFQTQIEQARANLIRSQADLDRLRVSLDDARTKLARARELSGRQLLPKSDLDTAEVNVRLSEAQIRSSEAQVTQAQASLNQNEVNLQHTVIEAPIDGLVISRSVDVGQTVAASMQAPTLFVLAADLTKMQVIANLDESDVGRIRPGQQVSFRVDAYAEDTFVGTVAQVRLEPKVAQNVVTYATVIDVPNNQLKLKPGMTANVTIEIARSDNVLRIPNGALRFRPTNEMYAAIGQTPPDPATLRTELGEGAGRRGGAPTGANQPPIPPPLQAKPATATPSAPPEPAARPPREEAVGRAIPGSGRGRGLGPAGSGGVGRGNLAERLQNLPPEQREQILQRMAERGATPGAERGRGVPPGAPVARTAPRPSSTNASAATTIDALFGPLTRVESQGRVWLYLDGQLKPVRLRLGLSDGQATELIEGDLQPGVELVTNISTGATTRPAATGGFLFAQPGRGIQGGFPGAGGGGNRGGGGR